MKRSFLCFALMACLAAASHGQALPVPGHWEKVDSLSPGTGLTLIMKSGDRIDGPYAGGDPEALHLRRDDGSLLSVPRIAVRRIVAAQKTDDRLLNGTLTGTAIGFGAGFLLSAAYNAKETASGPIWDGEAVGTYVGFGILGAGVGALTGALCDKAVKQEVVLYQAP